MVEMHRCIICEREVLEISIELPRLHTVYYIYNNVVFCDKHFSMASIKDTDALVVRLQDGAVVDASDELKKLGIEKGMSMHCVFLLLEAKN
ncbi:MAG: hypothetical protein IKM20_03365 [Erysipelotrichales bacterium]|nr:hypothetical protein [Erysipelotrichales bacterium]